MFFPGGHGLSPSCLRKPCNHPLTDLFFITSHFHHNFAGLSEFVWHPPYSVPGPLIPDPQAARKYAELDNMMHDNNSVSVM